MDITGDGAAMLNNDLVSLLIRYREPREGGHMEIMGYRE